MLLYWKIQTYKRPCWDTEVIVRTWARKFEKISSWRDFEVYDKEGNLICIATTQWVLIDVKKQKPAIITQEMAEKYGLNEKSVFQEPPKGKLKEEENMQKSYEYIASRRDIDANHHVNNVIYLEIAYNALPQDIKMDFENVEIYYKKQIKIGEEISIYCKTENNVHTVSIKSKDEKDLHAILKFLNN